MLTEMTSPFFSLAFIIRFRMIQARATGLQSCVMAMRVLRDLCQRTHTWSPLSQWVSDSNILHTVA